MKEGKRKGEKIMMDSKGQGKEKKKKFCYGDLHLYLKLQKGGSILVFHGVRQQGSGFSFKCFAKLVGKSLLKVG